MLYCPRCATPIDKAERAKMAIQEENIKKEVTELREMVRKYLNTPLEREEGATSEGVVRSQDQGRRRIDQNG